MKCPFMDEWNLQANAKINGIKKHSYSDEETIKIGMFFYRVERSSLNRCLNSLRFSSVNGFGPFVRLPLFRTIALK